MVSLRQSLAGGFAQLERCRPDAWRGQKTAEPHNYGDGIQVLNRHMLRANTPCRVPARRSAAAHPIRQHCGRVHVSQLGGHQAVDGVGGGRDPVDPLVAVAHGLHVGIWGCTWAESSFKQVTWLLAASSMAGGTLLSMPARQRSATPPSAHPPMHSSRPTLVPSPSQPLSSCSAASPPGRCAGSRRRR